MQSVSTPSYHIGDEENSNKSLNSLNINPLNMTTMGKVEEYDLRKRNWASYIARVRQYFKANSIKEELYTAILITVIGGEAYDLMTDLCNPKKPEDVKFEDLVKVMDNHLEPKPSEIAERYKFRQRKQDAQEKVAEYVANLKKLAKGCNFGEKLEENLRDQLVFGLKNDTIRQRLFAETKLDYATAYSLAVSLEAAEVNAGLMHEKETMMNKLSTSRNSRFFKDRQPRRSDGGCSHPGSKRKRCGHCGKDNHEEVQCFFRQAICHVCNKSGHISTVCNKTKFLSHKTKSESKPKVHRYHKYVKIDSDDSDSESTNLFSIKNDKKITKISENINKPLKVEVIINEIETKMEVDTGSAISAISKQFYDSTFRNLKLNKSSIKLKSYNGEEIQVLGYLEVSVKYNDLKLNTLKLYVIEEGGPPLIGRDWLSKLKMSIDNLFNRNSGKEINRINIIYIERGC